MNLLATSCACGEVSYKRYIIYWRKFCKEISKQVWSLRDDSRRCTGSKTAVQAIPAAAANTDGIRRNIYGVPRALRLCAEIPGG
jgi:hypothetical protein